MSTIIRFRQGDLWQHKGTKLRFERELGNRYLYFLVEPTLAPFQIEDAEGRLSAPDVEAFGSRFVTWGAPRQVGVELKASF